MEDYNLKMGSVFPRRKTRNRSAMDSRELQSNSKKGGNSSSLSENIVRVKVPRELNKKDEQNDNGSSYTPQKRRPRYSSASPYKIRKKNQKKREKNRPKTTLAIRQQHNDFSLPSIDNENYEQNKSNLDMTISELLDHDDDDDDNNSSSMSDLHSNFNISQRKSQTFSLELFDNPEYDPYTPNEWISFKKEGDPGASARSKHFNADGKCSWEPCFVIDYNNKSQTFLIQWKESGIQKRARRLNIIFDQEDEDLFEKRVREAEIAREEFSKEMKTSSFIEKMDVEEQTITEKQFEKIIEMSATNITSRNFHILDKFLRDLKTEFNHANKRAVLEEQSRDPTYYKNLENAGLIIPDRNQGAPEKGVIEIPGYSVKDFHKISKLVSQKLLFAQIPMLKTLQFVQNIWKQFSTSRFFDIRTIEKSNEHFDVYEFSQSQSRHRKSLIYQLNEDWVKVLRASFIEYINQYDSNRSEKKKTQQSDVHRFVGLVSFLMSGQLRSLVLDSCHSYMNFLHSYSDQPLNNRVTYLFENQSSQKCLFLLDLIVKSNQISFVPQLEDIEHLILDILDKILRETHRTIPTIETASKVFRASENDTYLRGLDPSDKEAKKFRQQARDIIKERLDELTNLKERYEQFQFLIIDDNSKIKEEILNCDLHDKEILKNIKQQINFLNDKASEAQFLSSNQVSFRMFIVDCQEAKQVLIDKANESIQSILHVVNERVTEEDNRISNEFQEIYKQAHNRPKNPEEMVELKEFFDSKQSTLSQLDKNIEKVKEIVQILHDFSFSIPKESFELHHETLQWPAKIFQILENNEELLAEESQQFQEDLVEQRETLKHNLNEYIEEIDSFHEYGDISRADEIAGEVNDLQEKIEKAEEKASICQQREKIFNWKKTNYHQFSTIRKKFIPYSELWTTVSEWKKKIPHYTDGAFMDIDPQEVKNNVNNWFNTVLKCMKTFKSEQNPLQVAKKMKSEIASFREHVPLITYLRNPGMRDRHWKQLAENTDFPLEEKDTITLSEILERGLENQIDLIKDISEHASKEHSIEQKLDGMLEEWKSVNFTLEEYGDRGTYILKDVERIINLIDDHIIKTQSLRGSPYIKQFEDHAKSWEQQLLRIQELLGSWLLCQKNWMYLEPVFSSKDIARQLTVEATRFEKIDKMWLKVMYNVAKNPTVLNVSSDPELKKNFDQANKYMDDILKSLNNYLETKRSAFPRFYFLSNEELLEIVSESKNPLKVQKHLNKILDNIDHLNFEDNMDITAMVSPQGETVEFNRTINPKDYDNKVEVWLKEVETGMQSTLKDIFKKAIYEYQKTTREKWLMDSRWPGQIVLVACQLYWTRELTKSLEQSGTKGLHEYYEQLNTQMINLIELIRNEQNGTKAETLSSLVVIEVHAKDIVSKLIDEEVESPFDFEFLREMRYYWDEDKEDLLVKMMHSTVKYGFEYLGNTGRLVVTPLTEKCYRTMMTALNMNMGGAPEGPAGTGKTETVKDLAKAVAKKCVVFNCSEGLDYKAMGRLFKGLAASGSWSCFDEFNRIEPDVLSVVAQQIWTIQQAIVSKKDSFTFEGDLIPLDTSCAVFITMNPGYAGRSELPDNLKALFRPCAMMIPDYALIAEISLFSYGFQNGRSLAKKLAATYRLCSEQLSSQDHYDYGMRAVKAVLLMAQEMKYNNPDMDEDIIMLKSIKGANLPKFIKEDIPLFENIISDLFPNIKASKSEHDQLIDAIHTICKDRNLKPDSVFVEKCLELYQIIKVRHGNMLVGGTMSGKTTIYTVLSSALTYLSFQQIEGYQPVDIKCLNPKSIGIQQLYGYQDMTSNEWKEGVLSSIFREYAFDKSDSLKWIILDGPVDATWIENMNTVLDDNKKLCLTSGETIQMSNNMALIFEAEGLAVASPATVSRCGMVYTEPRQLGWRPLVHHWAHSLPKQLLKHVPRIKALFEWFIPPTLEFINENVQYQSLTTTDLWLVSSLAKLIQSLVSEFFYLQHKPDQNTKNDPSNIDEKDIMNLFDCFFLFSVVWSFGGTLNMNGRQKFDEFFQKLLSKRIPNDLKKNGGSIQMPIPSSGSVFDFYFDSYSWTWFKWQQQVEQYTIPEDVDLNEVFVPTSDSSRYAYLLNKLASNGISTLLCGPTGTGKTKLVKNFMRSKPESELFSILLHFSGRTQAQHTQRNIDSKLQKRRLGVYGPPLGKQGTIFVDDMNMPVPEEYGAQPPLELLRQFLDQGGWYDFKGELKQISFRHIQDFQLIAAMQPSKTKISNRLLRHFGFINVEEANDSALFTIFSTILGSFLKSNLPNLHNTNSSITKATIELYRITSKKMLPIPAKSHYLFNLRDISKIIQGVASVDPVSISAKEDLLRLWYHESCRIFRDRLVDQTDVSWFNETIRNVSQEFFAMSLETIAPNEPIFAHFSEDSTQGQYQETEYSQAEKAMKNALEEYQNKNQGSLNMVVFDYAIDHVSRISRIICQPFGNALLVGVGGSGRQTLTKLAAYMASFDLFELNSASLSNIESWREELKKVILRAGCESKEIVLLLSENKINQEFIYEDINNILNVGEVNNLFNSEDLSYIYDTTKSLAKLSGINTESHAEVYNFFVKQSKRNLHLVLCMSPIGSTFRNKIRSYPSLVNCCTIDWFLSWPSEALNSVAYNTVENLDFSEEQKREIAKTSVQFHFDIQSFSEKYAEKMKRKVHVTPSSFLQLLNSFKYLMDNKSKEVIQIRSKYAQGLSSIEETEAVIEKLKQQQEQEQPKLLETRKETEKLMEKLKSDQKEADLTKVELKHQENDAKQRAENAQAMRDECEKDLDRAMPALNEAIQAVNSLNPRVLSEMKKMRSPPKGVRLVMESVCIMLQEEPVEIRGNTGGVKKDYWPTSQKLLASSDFIKRLVKYDRENIPPEVIEKIKPYLSNPKLNPKSLLDVSYAASSLCRWVWAMEKFYRANLVVIPKKEKLAEAEKQLEKTQKMLDEMRKKLDAEERRIQDMLTTLSEAENKKKSLEDSLEKCSVRLHRAQRLLDALSDEKMRWKEIVEKSEADEKNMIGDSLLAAAFITYLSPFGKKERDKYISKWHKTILSSSLESSEQYSFVHTLSTSLELLKWKMQGLPSDEFSIENAVVISNTNKWPLVIDPQGQARKWIRTSEKSNKLRVLKPSDANFLYGIEKSTYSGQPALLEHVGETLPPILDPLLRQEISRDSNGEFTLTLGEKEVSYSTNFKLYLTTNLPTPQYDPEISTNVTLVNFTITPEGLSEQLLSIVVEKEEKHLEDQRIQIIKDHASNQEQLEKIEDKMLSLLSESGSSESMLDREDLIEALDQSKNTAREVQNKVKLAKKTEENIEKARQQYQKFAQVSSALFFISLSLAYINPMYTFGIEWFIELFIKSIEETENANSVQNRVEKLKNHFLYTFYENVCRSLFQKDKLLLSFFMSIKTADTPIPENEWIYFLTGRLNNSEPPENPMKSWLPDARWSDIFFMSQLDAFDGFLDNFKKQKDKWLDYFMSSIPQEQILPGKWNNALSPFQQMLVLKALRPDKIGYGMKNVIINELGNDFVHPPNLDLQHVFNESWCTTPILFILTSGSDPKSSIKKLADRRAMNLVQVSLGSGQGEVASREIRDCAKRGGWVLLENCHLSEPGYLQQLARIIDGLDPDTTHIDFRLWLTTSSTPEFPVSILQKAIKITNEPPQGVRANLLRTYTSHPISEQEFFESFPNKPFEWRSLIFGLAFFHAIVQERRTYGPIGWNNPYEFSDEDLKISLYHLKMMLKDDENTYESENDNDNDDEYQNDNSDQSENENDIPFEALKYVIGDINYGGRVTDPWDQRALKHILDGIVSEDLVYESNYKLAESCGYYVPDLEFYDDFIDHIKEFPEQQPELFGLAPNADISKDKNESNQLMNTIKIIESGRMNSSVSNKEQIVMKSVCHLIKEIPKQFNVEEAKEKFPPETYEESMNAVLIQELHRFNKLLNLIKSSLEKCKAAIQGFIVMSTETESLVDCIYQNQLPKLWRKLSYPSSKSLRDYITDLKERVKFFQDWIAQGQPIVFWISGVFFIKSFLTGILQNYSRKYSVPIDQVSFTFEFFESTPFRSPKDGAFVRGLFLEGATWNKEKQVIDDPGSTEMNCKLPVMWLKPTENKKSASDETYTCPVYVTPERKGTLSTTGHSTNYVLSVELPIESETKPESVWIKRGTALLCQQDV